jgi:hypothetical protein
MGKFVFFMIHSQNKRKITATSRVSAADLSTQQKQVDKVVEEYSDIFSSPTGVPLHCQVKHPIDLTPDAPLPNGPVYRRSLLENEEIKRQIQELLHKGHILSQLITLREPNRAGTEERWNLATLH